jgi:hypothetical protein
MINFIIIIILLTILFLGTLLYFLHVRVEKVSENQAIMLQWFESIKQNEERIISDFNKLRNEYKTFEKEVRTK